MSRSQLARLVAINLVVAALYFAAGKWGLTLAFVHVSATAVWPPSGIALAALLLLGYRISPGIFVGAFLVNLTTAGTVLTSLGIATGNTLEGIVGAYLVNLFANGRRAFDRPQDVFKFAALAGLLSTMIAATIGVSSLSLAGFATWSNFGPIWLTWWLGDAVGAIVAAPFLILLFEESPVRWDAARVAEAAAVLLATVVAGSGVFGSFIFPGTKISLGYLCIPPLLWTAFRFGKREASTAVIVLSAIAIHGTLNHTGPFALGSENDSLLLLQTFVAVLSITTLTVAAVVSERNATDEALRSSIRDLESFGYAVAHDLRTPLRSISGFSQVLLDDYSQQLDANARNHLSRVTASALRMGELIDALLDLSRGSTLRREAVDLSATARSIVDELRATEPGRQVDVSIDTGMVAYADANLMRVVLHNLLGNAWKFTKDRQAAKIRFGQTPGSDRTIYFVEDNGVGFDPALAPKLFKPFEQLHRKDEFGGTGIGLVTVQRAVNRHGGHVWAAGALGRGSTFYFTL